MKFYFYPADFTFYIKKNRFKKRLKRFLKILAIIRYPKSSASISSIASHVSSISILVPVALK